jgi:hypothetical protein
VAGHATVANVTSYRRVSPQPTVIWSVEVRYPSLLTLIVFGPPKRAP